MCHPTIPCSEQCSDPESECHNQCFIMSPARYCSLHPPCIISPVSTPDIRRHNAASASLPVPPLGEPAILLHRSKYQVRNDCITFATTFPTFTNIPLPLWQLGNFPFTVYSAENIDVWKRWPPLSDGADMWGERCGDCQLLVAATTAHSWKWMYRYRMVHIMYVDTDV